MAISAILCLKNYLKQSGGFDKLGSRAPAKESGAGEEKTSTEKDHMNIPLTIPDPAKAKAYFEDKVSFTTGPVEVEHMIKAGADINVVDVRAVEDYEKGHVPGAINLPKERWSMLEGLHRDKINILYCYTHVCHLAANAAVEFARSGFPVMEMDGGFEAWKDNDLDVERDTVNRLKRTTARLLHKQ